MHTQSLENWTHEHVFLGAHHARNERRTWFVITLCGVMMLVEIAGGIAFGSMALLADGLHMSTHAGAFLIAALAYTYARRTRATTGLPSAPANLAILPRLPARSCSP